MARRNFFDTVGASSLSPTLIYSLDLTAQAQQSPIAPGNFTVAGKTWKWSRNTADPVGSLNASAGSGLRITSSDAADGWVGIVALPFTEIGLDAYALRNTVVVTAQLATTVAATNTAWAGIGVMRGSDTTDLSGTGACSAWLSRRYTGGNEGLGPYIYIDPNDYPAAGAAAYTNSLSDDVSVVAFHDVMSVDFFSGVYSGGWPAWSALRSRSPARVPVAGFPSAGGAYPPAGADLSIAMLAYKPGGAAGQAMSAAIKLLKVEVY